MKGVTQPSTTKTFKNSHPQTLMNTTLSNNGLNQNQPFYHINFQNIQEQLAESKYAISEGFNKTNYFENLTKMGRDIVV